MKHRLVILVMSSTRLRFRLPLLLLLVGLVASIPAFAGSAVVGSVAGSLNATVGGQALLPNTVIFSGDSLQVKDGAAVVALDNGGRMAFGRDTAASFLKEANDLTVLLDRGNVSLYHPENSAGMAVKVAGVLVSPAPGYKTLGDVAMVNGLVVVTTKEGKLHVTGGNGTVDVAQGKTITITPKTARAPQAGGTQKLAGGGSTALEAGALGAGTVAAILAGIAISRGNDARDAAKAANSTAASAVSAANAATSAAKAATSAATAAGAAANLAGCALNNFGADTGKTGILVKVPSPYAPPAGFTCPPNPNPKKY